MNHENPTTPSPSAVDRGKLRLAIADVLWTSFEGGECVKFLPTAVDRILEAIEPIIVPRDSSAVPAGSTPTYSLETLKGCDPYDSSWENRFTIRVVEHLERERGYAVEMWDRTVGELQKSGHTISDLRAQLTASLSNEARLRDELAQARDFHDACIKILYEALGIDGSDGEYRFKWVSLEVGKLTAELTALREELAALQQRINDALVHVEVVASSLNSNDPYHEPKKGSIAVVCHALNARQILSNQ